MALRQTVRGYLNEKGEIQVELPENWEPGEIQVVVPVKVDTPQTDWDNQPWTQKELDAALNFSPIPAENIVPGGWEDCGILDSAVMVEMMRTSLWDVYMQIVKKVRV